MMTTTTETPADALARIASPAGGGIKLGTRSVSGSSGSSDARARDALTEASTTLTHHAR